MNFVLNQSYWAPRTSNIPFNTLFYTSRRWWSLCLRPTFGPFGFSLSPSVSSPSLVTHLYQQFLFLLYVPDITSSENVSWFFQLSSVKPRSKHPTLLQQPEPVSWVSEHMTDLYNLILFTSSKLALRSTDWFC